MKRILLAVAVCLLFTANLSAKKQKPLTVKEGEVVSVLKEAATAVLTTDYSETYVGKNGARTTPLADFLKERGGNHIDDWAKDVKAGMTFFIHEFNKKNKRGLQFVEEDEKSAAQYCMELKIKTMDWGMNGLRMIGGAFAPKAGGYIIWGELIIKKMEDGNVVATIDIDNLKGQGSVNDYNRVLFLYMELSIELLKLKKSKS